MKIWIDDERPAPDESWSVARTASEAVVLLGYAIYTEGLDAVSFDHDLGEELTGYDLAEILEKLAFQGKLNWFKGALTCHSANPTGRANIEDSIKMIKWFIWQS